jgi:sugar phosphate permease
MRIRGRPLNLLKRKSLTVRRYFYIILPVFIGSVIAYLDRINIAYAALTMNADLGFSEAVFGMGAGIFFVGYVLFEVPGALIAERWSPRIWLSRIMISWGLVSAFMAFVESEWQFYLVRFLLGIAEASFYPVVYASVIPRWFTRSERPKALAAMLTSLQVSAIIGSPLAGWILGLEVMGFRGWQALFLTEAVPAVLFGVIMLFLIEDRPEDARWLSTEEKKYLADSFSAEREEKAAAKQYTVWMALRDREVLRLCLIYFLWITGYWGFNYWMPTVLKDVSGWSNFKIGWMIVLPMGVSLAVMMYIGHSSSRTGEKRWHGAVPMFLAAVGMSAGAFIRDPYLNLVFVSITAAGVYGAFGVWWSYPTTFLGGAAAAGAVGLINSCGNIGGYVGPYLTGMVKNISGSFTWAHLFLAFSLALSGAMMLTLRRR